MNHLESMSAWTDGIPICKMAGIGNANNEIYRKDGKRVEMHRMHNRSFHFFLKEMNLGLYGLFDGFNGADVADFCSKRMPAELLLGQVVENSSDDMVKMILKQAFENADREYFESITQEIMTKMVMKSDPQVRLDDPRLRRLNAKMEVGCSATVALLLQVNNLYILIVKFA